MSDGKVFTDSTKDKLKTVIDDAIKLGVFGEIVDGPIIRGTINVIDHYGDKFIKDEYDAPLDEAVNDILEKRYDDAKTKLATLSNKIIDLPVLDETTEEAVFQSGYSFLLRILMNYLEKKNG